MRGCSGEEFRVGEQKRSEAQAYSPYTYIVVRSAGFKLTYPCLPIFRVVGGIRERLIGAHTLEVKTPASVVAGKIYLPYVRSFDHHAHSTSGIHYVPCRQIDYTTYVTLLSTGANIWPDGLVPRPVHLDLNLPASWSPESSGVFNNTWNRCVCLLA